MGAESWWCSSDSDSDSQILIDSGSDCDSDSGILIESDSNSESGSDGTLALYPRPIK